MTDTEVELDPAAEAATETALARLPTSLSQIEASLGLPEGSVVPNGLILTNPDTTFEEWQQYAYTIGFVDRWGRFALGDWLLFGEDIFGDDDAAQAVEGTPIDRYDVAHRITGLDPATLLNYVTICRKVPHAVRRIELGITIHGAVAGLERANQIYWLGQAVANGWDRSQLRQAIKDATTPHVEGEPEPEVVDPPLSRMERLERAAQLVYQQAQPTDDGGVLVPSDPWRQFAEALGEE